MGPGGVKVGAAAAARLTVLSMHLDGSVRSRAAVPFRDRAAPLLAAMAVARPDVAVLHGVPASWVRSSTSAAALPPSFHWVAMPLLAAAPSRHGHDVVTAVAARSDSRWRLETLAAVTPLAVAVRCPRGDLVCTVAAIDWNVGHVDDLYADGTARLDRAGHEARRRAAAAACAAHALDILVGNTMMNVREAPGSGYRDAFYDAMNVLRAGGNVVPADGGHTWNAGENSYYDAGPSGAAGASIESTRADAEEADAAETSDAGEPSGSPAVGPSPTLSAPQEQRNRRHRCLYTRRKRHFGDVAAFEVLRVACTSSGRPAEAAPMRPVVVTFAVPALPPATEAGRV